MTNAARDLFKELESALELQAQGKLKESADMLTLLVDAGLARANVYLGWMHQAGLGTRVDLVLAEKFYRAGASANEVVAKYYLASLLRINGDLVGALKWYESASENGHPSAPYWAYLLHSDRESPTFDQGKAMFYLEIAAARGHYFAQRDLARERLRSTKSPLLACKYIGAYVSAIVRGAFAAIRNAERPNLH